MSEQKKQVSDRKREAALRNLERARQIKKEKMEKYQEERKKAIAEGRDPAEIPNPLKRRVREKKNNNDTKSKKKVKKPEEEAEEEAEDSGDDRDNSEEDGDDDGDDDDSFELKIVKKANSKGSKSNAKKPNSKRSELKSEQNPEESPEEFKYIDGLPEELVGVLSEKLLPRLIDHLGIEIVKPKKKPSRPSSSRQTKVVVKNILPEQPKQETPTPVPAPAPEPKKPDPAEILKRKMFGA